MKPGATRYRVFGAVAGRAALVNVFPRNDLAASLLRALRKRYTPHGATFWIDTSDDEAQRRGSLSWRVLRDRLRQLEPHKAPAWSTMVKHGNTPPIAPAKPITTDDDIDAFLASGRAITIGRPHRASARGKPRSTGARR